MSRSQLRRCVARIRSNSSAPKVRPVAAQGMPSLGEVALGQCHAFSGSKPSTFFAHRVHQQRVQRVPPHQASAASSKLTIHSLT
jgi:hypothetical protein